MQETAFDLLYAANDADSQRWCGLVVSSPTPDVYFSPAYSQATSELEHSESIAIIAGSEACRFLAPLLVRRMSPDVSGSAIRWTDACSPYGYGGLLPLSGCQPSARDIRCFFNELYNWCSDRSLVCCVIRLHPLMRQDEWFKPEELQILRVQMRGTTTAINLESWDNERDRPYGMRKDRRLNLNVARRTLRVRWTNGEDPEIESDINLFCTLYERSMEAHGAGEFYRFSASYFSALTSLGHHVGIASAWMGDELAGASIFLIGRDYAHYHLAAVNEIGRKHKAATLLVVEGAKWARQRGCTLLHLGGGLNPGDSLEDFKFSFGGQLYRYAYLICVADPERFEQLCQLPNAPWPYSGAAKMSSIEETSH